MNEEWRYKAIRVTKYNPINRDENGYYTGNDWVGFFQIGKIFDDGELTLESYLATEQKYIAAAKLFFNFHGCEKIRFEKLEKNSFSYYHYDDEQQLSRVYYDITEGLQFEIDELEIIMKLILRELIWGELFCIANDEVVVRFGYDYYMYFNSPRDWSQLNNEIKNLGLFVE